MEAFGCVSAEDVVATRDLPEFASSAMDGFAVRASDVAAATLRGERHDAGDRLGYLRANLVYASKRPELAEGVKALCREILG